MEITKEYLVQEYIKNKRSTTDIAKDCGTYPTKINRLLKEFDIPIRSRSESQKLVCKKNHPTRGKIRTEEEKVAISKGGAKSWSAERKKSASKQAEEQWKNRSDVEKDKILKSAHQGLMRASKEGSKIERFIIRFLRSNGVNAVAHENLLTNEKLEVDILLTNKDIVVELDGPTHYLPIYGQEKLDNQRRADNEKDALLTELGYRVIRIIVVKKNMSNNDLMIVGEKLLKLIKSKDKITRWIYE